MSHPLEPSVTAPAQHGQLQASSLVEVLVALSLSSIMFVIAMTIWLQINGYQAPYRQIDYRMRARLLIEDATQRQSLQDAVFTLEGIQFQREVRQINAESNLYEIRVKAYGPENELLFQRGKVVRYGAD
jgi:hypothetical protein